MKKALVSAGVVLTATVGLMGGAAAQTFGATGGAGITAVRLHSAAGPLSEQLSGLARGVTGRLSAWRVDVEVVYSEGELRPSAGPSAARDLVEGHLMLGVRPAPWLSLKGGPRARGFIQGGVTQRWLHWEGRARAEAPVAGRGVRGYLELWRAMGGSVTNAAGPFGGSQGGEAGMSVRVPRTPISLRLSYGIERARLASDVLMDTVESLTLAVAVGSAR